MLAGYRGGRQADALRALARTRTALVEASGSSRPRSCRRRNGASSITTVSAAGGGAARPVKRRAVRWSTWMSCSAGLDSTGSGVLPSRRRRRRPPSSARRPLDDVARTAGDDLFVEPIDAVRAAQMVIDDTTRVAVDFGDLEYGDDEPAGPPLVRAARLVAVANPGQVVCSASAHQALTAAGVSGWAAASLGRFDIVGLDRERRRLPARGRSLRRRVPTAAARSASTAAAAGRAIGSRLRAARPDRCRRAAARSTAPTNRRSVVRWRCASSTPASSSTRCSSAASSGQRSGSPGPSTRRWSRCSTTGANRIGR